MKYQNEHYIYVTMLKSVKHSGTILLLFIVMITQIIILILAATIKAIICGSFESDDDMNTLQKLNPNKGVGPDGLPPKLYTVCSIKK